MNKILTEINSHIQDISNLVALNHNKKEANVRYPLEFNTFYGKMKAYEDSLKRFMALREAIIEEMHNE